MQRRDVENSSLSLVKMISAPGFLVMVEYTHHNTSILRSYRTQKEKVRRQSVTSSLVGEFSFASTILLSFLRQLKRGSLLWLYDLVFELIRFGGGGHKLHVLNLFLCCSVV